MPLYGASLTDDARVVLNDHNVLIIEATGIIKGIQMLHLIGYSHQQFMGISKEQGLAFA
jgi:hypothetical protein